MKGREDSAYRGAQCFRFRVMLCLLLAGMTIAKQTTAADTPEDAALSSKNSTQDTGETSRDNFSLDAKPVWEFGIGGGYIAGFDYPASEDPNRAALALPYFIYRSELLRVGGGGVKAVAIERPKVKLDLSVAASLNAKSEGNRARESLPDLDFLFEIGPELEVRLLDRRYPVVGRTTLSANTKVRAVFGTDFKGVNNRGVVFSSGLRFAQRGLYNMPLDFLASLNVTFADQRLQEYFYEVPEEFATESRPRFSARGGYLSSTLFLGLAIRPLRNVRLFTGANLGQFAGAANEESPLYETSASVGFAAGFVWRLATSERKVLVLESE